MHAVYHPRCRMCSCDTSRSLPTKSRQTVNKEHAARVKRATPRDACRTRTCLGCSWHGVLVATVAKQAGPKRQEDQMYLSDSTIPLHCRRHCEKQQGKQRAEAQKSESVDNMHADYRARDRQSEREGATMASTSTWLTSTW